MDIIYWILDVTSNQNIMGFLDTHSVVVLFVYGITMVVLRYYAKKTPSTDDDELLAAIDGKVGELFHSSVQKRANGS